MADKRKRWTETEGPEDFRQDPGGGAGLPGRSDNYLSDLLSGTRTGNTVTAGYGPFSASYFEQRQPQGLAEPLPLPPTSMFNASLNQPIGNAAGEPVSLRGSVNALRDGPFMEIAPAFGIGVGPLSLNAGIAHRRYEDQASTVPQFGANLELPIGGGQFTGGASVIPAERQNYFAQYNYPIDQQSGVQAMIDHTRPHGEGRPETRFGVAYRRRF